MLNICLALITAQFSITKKREIKQMLNEQKRFSLKNPYFQDRYEKIRMLWKNKCQMNCCRISRLVNSKLFDWIIFSCIILNTVSMSTEYHGQPTWSTNIFEYINLIFLILFTIEIFLKILVQGCLKYLENSLNILDVGILCISFIELFQGKYNRFMVLRIFRFLPTLRRQLVSLMKLELLFEVFHRLS